MNAPRGESFALLLEVDRAELAPAIENALRLAEIPFHSGVQAAPEPRIVFSVPASRLDEARAIVGQQFGVGPLAPADDEDDESDDALEEVEPPPPLSWSAVRACAGLVAIHLAIVFTWLGHDPTSELLVARGALLNRVAADQPWRLISYQFLHSDPKHVLGNGLSLLAFSVPLAGAFGLPWTALIYLLSGIAGGIAAVAAYPGSTVTVGSSGAVAGLFGAWLVGAIRRARRAPQTRRARLRLAGIGLLALPSLVIPETASGERISVAAHLGGLAAGVALGIFVAARTHPPQDPTIQPEDGMRARPEAL